MLRLPFKPVKSQSFPQRLKIAELLLEKAARLYESAKWTEAIDQLEQSVSVFAEPPHPKKWEDSVPEDLALVRFSHDEARQIEHLRIRQFDLLSHCYFAVHNGYACVRICDYWLSLQPQSLSALKLRAKARFRSEIVSEIDCVMALKDLEFAHQLDRHDEEVQTLYKVVRMKLRQYEENKHQLHYSLSTQLPEVSEDEDSSDFEPELPGEFMSQLQCGGYEYDKELSYEQDPSKPIPVEVSELGKFIETRGMEMVRIYEENGQLQEAEELKEKLRKALAAKKQLEKISQLDFNRPKKKLYQLAQSFGIDLLDPSVQNEFRKIQQQNLEDIREWLKQNQWSYTDKATQQQQQVLARQELAKIQFKKRNRPSSQRTKLKPSRKTSKDQNALTINNNITYNQTFNQCGSISNSNSIQQSNVQQKQEKTSPEAETEESISCGSLLNLMVFLLIIIAFLSTIYYSIIR